MTDNTAAPAATAPSIPSAPVAPPAAPAQLGTTAWVAIFCWPLVVAAATLVYTNKKGNERMAELIASRPDIAVVDDVELVKLAIDNGADRYNPASVIDQIGQIVRGAGMEDTILLSKSMIMYAPEERRLRVKSAASAGLTRAQPAPAAAETE